MNKIQKAYEALKQTIKEEGFEPSITVWIHNHTNPHMSISKAIEVLGDYKYNVDTKLFKDDNVHMVEYVDGVGGFRIGANLDPKPKENHEWLLID